ncbi:MAG: hypothetical protein KDK89_19855 [Alphaproteobacteria bacterium]|nr:hypothetical protein [Alphaproteobacteria bacterium]
MAAMIARIAANSCLTTTVLAALAMPVAASHVPRIGFEVLTHDDETSVAAGTVRFRFNGTIEYPMAENLKEMWEENRLSAQAVELELDSPGGSLTQAKAVIAVLQAIAAEVDLTTIVRQGKVCASACVPVFMQGKTRMGGTASAWMFHGACHRFTNVPNASGTLEYLSLMEAAGLDADFICKLTESGFLEKPGEYWLSGYELIYVHKSNVINHPLDPWQPATPLVPPFDPNIRPR